ncbi:182 kDa tankyrase-1-binding protein-like [Microtus oregoni]|uniref:182 kDa tankyrase-1-binding protein-like n=1 Tax=Microtus oregoni TaxID=111838 RepID=UPI001BB19135|nr:182 kDa tankyrase-1-binding protein-like [Microtus oregoni]XP_041495648.1 182 kDa tankyrase-1-binding protein-like [Microtus oregoni]XP_041495649.1 182 kDa tankyrase-1-binding protein-like [Microtus oregoni]
MKVGETTAMASPLPQEMGEELAPLGSEPGDPRAKPPVKPKPRTLSSKPALPAKPSLLVPVGPRPPRGPLAELPSARKMNMLAGPQPYGVSKRPLPFAPRPAAEAPAVEVTQEFGKEDAGKEDLTPLTPPARCAALAGVRKAPAPFRPSSERFATSTVEEILAKMEQPRKEIPASPDRLWGSRLTFNHDGSSRYGPRTYGTPGPREDDKTTGKGQSQEGTTKSPAESQEERSKTPEERSITSSPAVNGDLAKLTSSEPPTDVPKTWTTPTSDPISEHGGCTSTVLPADASVLASVPASESPRLSSRQCSPHHSQFSEPPSLAASEAAVCPHVTPASSSATLPDEHPHHSPSSELPTEAAPATFRPSSSPVETVSGHPSPEQPPAVLPQPLMEGAELPDLTRTFPCGEEAVARSRTEPCPSSLAQRRFSEGVLRPPNRDQEKLGGSLVALPQDQGSQSALDRPFGSGTESNWSLSRSFEWTFPTKPSGLGVWRLDSPPPSPITEASEAAEAAEAGSWPVSAREEGVSQLGPGAPSSPESPGRPVSGVQGSDPGVSLPQRDDVESQPPSPAVLSSTVEGPAGTPLLQAEESYEDQESLAGRESPIALATREAALPVLEPVLGQQQPTPPDQPCILFVPDVLDHEQALPSEEEVVTLGWAETTQPRTEAQDPCRVSPEPTGPESSSRWLDDLLASPPPNSGSARRAAGSELKDIQSPSTCSEGLLGWAQKDLQSEFGVAADSHRSSFGPASWSQDASQNYSLGAGSPGGDPGLGNRDWSSECGQGSGQGGTREWASRCSLGQEVIGASGGQDESEVSVHEWAVGKPAQLSNQGPESDAQEWEFRKRDSQGTYSSRDKELQDQEFGKRDSLGSFSARDVSLQDWEFGKRDADEKRQELGMKDLSGGYSSHDAEKQDREFEKRDSVLDIRGSVATAQQDQEFGKSSWLQDYSGGSRALSLQDRGFGARTLSSGFSPEEAQQQDEEFEKKTPSGEDRFHATSRDTGHLEGGESGDLLSPSTPKLQDGAIRQKDQGNWQDGGSSQEITGLQGRIQAGGSQSPGNVDSEDKERGQRGWAGEFGLGVAGQSEAAFSPGHQDWSRDLCMEAPGSSYKFGIIGNDRVSGAGLSSSEKMGGGHFVPPGETKAVGALDWTDQLGLRNLEVSSCVSSGRPSEAGENVVGQMGWSASLGLNNGDLTRHLGTGGSEEPRGMGVGEKDWTSDNEVRSRDLSGQGERGGHSQARESGVGQPDWSGVEAGEFLKSRERGVGQADWTPDLGLRNMAPGAGCSPGEPRELGVGQVDWSDNLGLRNLEVSCDLESGGSRGCGVGQMDWTQDLGLRNLNLCGAPSEVRECGVGRVGPGLELNPKNSGSLSPGLENEDPLETRELGVGETSGPDTQGEGSSSPSLETHPEDTGMDTGEAPGLASPSRCLARSPPSGSQSLSEEMMTASSSKAAAQRESAASGPRVLLEEEGAVAGAGQGEPEESSRDPLPPSRPQPDGEASQVQEVDGTWNLTGGARQDEQGSALPPRRPPRGPLPSCPSEDFSFIEDTEILDSAMYRSRANLGRKRGHRAPAIRPGGTLGLSETADSDARLFQDSTEPRASRVPSSDEEVVEEPQSRRTRMSLGSKGLKVNLFPGLSPSALKAKLRSRNRSAEEGEATESKSSQKESSVQRSKSCKVPGLGKPLTLPPKPEKSSGSEGSSPNWLQALKLKKKKI